MKIINKPEKKEWEEILKRPIIQKEELNDIVTSIIDEVKKKGDKALLRLTKELDGVILGSLKVSEQEFKEAEAKVPQELKEAINIAYKNIYKFHKSQESQEELVETLPGVKCWRKSVAIEKVGLYIPGGSAPLFSTILMLGIPAQIAGCQQKIICTPPDKNGEVNEAILYAAKLIGITNIFKVGGAQAIAAMANGTESILKVYKIFGPGNQFVTKAKELVQQEGVAIDMPAGPSEVLVIADDTCYPEFVAADLLSQAEHGKDSQVILLTDSKDVAQKCLDEVGKQVEHLPRKEMAVKTLDNSKIIVLNSMNECIEMSNEYAPEHLIIASENSNKYVDKIINAGSVFLGNYSCESAGDYASGTNHTLPTNGFAKNYSGVSLDSFVKKITYQELSKEGIVQIGKAIEIMAEAEQLMAHKNAVSLRLPKVNKSLNND